MSRNIKFIMLTVVFAVILIYIYSVFGYLFYSRRSTSPLVHDGVLGSDQESCFECKSMYVQV